MFTAQSYSLNCAFTLRATEASREMEVIHFLSDKSEKSDKFLNMMRSTFAWRAKQTSCISWGYSILFKLHILAANDHQPPYHERREQTQIFWQLCVLSGFYGFNSSWCEHKVRLSPPAVATDSGRHGVTEGRQPRWSDSGPLGDTGPQGEVVSARVSAQRPTGCQTGSRMQCVPGLCAGNDSGTPAGLVSQGVAWHAVIREPQSDMPHATDCTHAPFSRLAPTRGWARQTKDRDGTVLMWPSVSHHDVTSEAKWN